MQQKKMILVGLIASGLAACGGGGGGSNASTNSPVTTTPPPAITPVSTSLSGTAATGQAISGTVVAIDTNGKISPVAATSADGGFTVDVSGMTAPFILHVIGTAGGTQVSLNSVATAAGQTVNITPLTDLIVSTAAGVAGGEALTTACTPVNTAVPSSCLTALQAATNGTNLTQAVTNVMALIAPLNTAGTNPLTGSFTANGTGMDAVLDQILVSPDPSNGPTATITLISTNAPLGSVSSSGAVTLSTAPTATELTQSVASSTALNEIRVCLASFNALYPNANFTAPSATRVGDFIDPTFNMGAGADQAAMASALSDPAQAATPGLVLTAAGFSPFDMSPLTGSEIASLSTQTVVDIIKARTTTALTFDGANQATRAWVKMNFSTDAGINNMLFLRGAAYNGCPGGWKLAGSQHVDMHQNARINRSIDSAGVATYSRQFAFHADKDEITAEGADTITIKGPGLVSYTGTPATPVGAPRKLVLTLPTDLTSSLWITQPVANTYTPGNKYAYYGSSDALHSCQDLGKAGLMGNTYAGLPCLDESAVAPGKLYSWVLKSGGDSGTIVGAFAFQINAVPLSVDFATANASSLFATLTGVTPSGITSLNSALASAPSVLDDVFTFTYTQQQNVYGSRMDNCGLYLYKANNSSPALYAEQNAIGKQTSCTFNTVSLNAGDLTKPIGPIANGYVDVTTIVLGNQASSGAPYPN